MKYLVVALTLIFSMSGSVNADDHNTRWVLLRIFVDHSINPPYVGVAQPKPSSRFGDVHGGTFETESDCYKALKDLSLAKNKKSIELGLSASDLIKIEIIDDIKIRAQYYSKREINSLHCVQITLD